MCSLGSSELLELCWKVWLIVFCDFNSSVWKPILKHICFHSLLSTHSFHRCRMCIDSLHMTLKSECITSTFMQKSVHLERELSTFPSTVLGAIGSWVLFTLLDSSFLPLSLWVSQTHTHTHIRAQCVVRRLRTQPNRATCHLSDKMGICPNCGRRQEFCLVRRVVYLPKRHISYDLWINIMNFLQKYFELLCFFLISYSKLNNFTCIGPLIEKLSKNQSKSCSC